MCLNTKMIVMMAMERPGRLPRGCLPRPSNFSSPTHDLSQNAAKFSSQRATRYALVGRSKGIWTVDVQRNCPFASPSLSNYFPVQSPMATGTESHPSLRVSDTLTPCPLPPPKSQTNPAMWSCMKASSRSTWYHVTLMTTSASPGVGPYSFIDAHVVPRLGSFDGRWSRLHSYNVPGCTLLHLQPSYPQASCLSCVNTPSVLSVLPTIYTT